MEQFCQSKGKYSTYRDTTNGEVVKFFSKLIYNLMDEVLAVHLYSTRTAEESRGRPGYPAVAVNLDVDLQRHFKHSIVTANTKYSITDHIFSISFIFKI